MPRGYSTSSPDALEVHVATAKMPPIVLATYEHGDQRVMLIFGFDRADARRVADAVDWPATILAPGPANPSSLYRVDVQGHPGLAIEAVTVSAGSQRRYGVSTVLWSDAGRVFAIRGNRPTIDLIEMANSLR